MQHKNLYDQYLANKQERIKNQSIFNFKNRFLSFEDYLLEQLNQSDNLKTLAEQLWQINLEELGTDFWEKIVFDPKFRTKQTHIYQLLNQDYSILKTETENLKSVFRFYTLFFSWFFRLFLTKDELSKINQLAEEYRQYGVKKLQETFNNIYQNAFKNQKFHDSLIKQHILNQDLSIHDDISRTSALYESLSTQQNQLLPPDQPFTANQLKICTQFKIIDTKLSYPFFHLIPVGWVAYQERISDKIKLNYEIYFIHVYQSYVSKIKDKDAKFKSQLLGIDSADQIINYFFNLDIQDIQTVTAEQRAWIKNICFIFLGCHDCNLNNDASPTWGKNTNNTDLQHAQFIQRKINRFLIERINAILNSDSQIYQQELKQLAAKKVFDRPELIAHVQQIIDQQLPILFDLNESLVNRKAALYKINCLYDVLEQKEQRLIVQNIAQHYTSLMMTAINQDTGFENLDNFCQMFDQNIDLNDRYSEYLFAQVHQYFLHCYFTIKQYFLNFSNQPIFNNNLSQNLEIKYKFNNSIVTSFVDYYKKSEEAIEVTWQVFIKVTANYQFSLDVLGDERKKTIHHFLAIRVLYFNFVARKSNISDLRSWLQTIVKMSLPNQEKIVLLTAILKITQPQATGVINVVNLKEQEDIIYKNIKSFTDEQIKTTQEKCKQEFFLELPKFLTFKNFSMLKEYQALDQNTLFNHWDQIEKSYEQFCNVENTINLYNLQNWCDSNKHKIAKKIIPWTEQQLTLSLLATLNRNTHPYCYKMPIVAIRDTKTRVKREIRDPNNSFADPITVQEPSNAILGFEIVIPKALPPNKNVGEVSKKIRRQSVVTISKRSAKALPQIRPSSASVTENPHTFYNQNNNISNNKNSDIINANINNTNTQLNVSLNSINNINQTL